MLIPLLKVAGGLVLLLVAADLLVRSCVTLARRIQLSGLVIGLTVVAFGTSLPELSVSLDAASRGLDGLALGNIIGSNIANILLILGIAALIRPLPSDGRSFYYDGATMMVATALFTATAVFGWIGQWHGVAALGLLSAYLLTSYRIERRGGEAVYSQDGEDTPNLGGGTVVILLAIAVGLAGIMIGADLLVNGAVVTAQLAGVSESVIGLTMVAAGTSLPELATVAAASIRRQGGMILGNIIGSNLFNLLGILGTVALVFPLSLPEKMIVFDIWILLAVSALMITFMYTGRRLTRVEGMILLALYGMFILAQATGLGEAVMSL